MKRAKRLLDAIDRYEAILGESASIREGTEDRRREAVQLRRLIAERIAEVGAAGHEWFVETTQSVEFRNRFAKMRSTMAHHQASWPIVCIVPEDVDYLQSLARVRDTNSAFVEWVRQAVRT